MKALTLRQARDCETAADSRCKCRCHGTFHGRQRGLQWFDIDPRYFADLPEGDPHKTRGPVQLRLPPDLVLDVRYGAS